MRIALHIEYDGTNYCGWQIQQNGISVQQKIAEAIQKLTGEDSVPHASGRTDAGVHALCQVAHFDTCSSVPPGKFFVALNTLLPEDIRIKDSFAVPDTFHARFDAKAKHYRYIFHSARTKSALHRNCMFCPLPLDIDAMQEGAAHILGAHDFSAFCAAGSDTLTKVRTVEKLTLSKEGEFIHIDIRGDGFLYNMVRIIAGTLLLVGQHKLLPESVKHIVDSKDRTLAGPTAPPQGLFLVEVFY